MNPLFQQKSASILRAYGYSDTSIESIKNGLKDKLEKGDISKELHESALNQLDTIIEKAGEGSRGGHIIGHTKSGKPVYANKGIMAKEYDNYSSQDHMDASEIHAEKSRGHREESYKSSPSYYSGKSEDERHLSQHHDSQSYSHRQRAGQLDKKTHRESLSDDEKKAMANQKGKQIEHHGAMHKFYQGIVDHTKSAHKGKEMPEEARRAVDHHSSMANHHKSEKERLEKE